MGGAGVIVSAAVSVVTGCLILAGAPTDSHAMALRALAESEGEARPTSPRRQGRYDGLLHRTSQALSVITDDVTSVRVGIPFGIVGAPKDGTHGRNWKAPDRRLDIDTLRFRDRSFVELFNTLRTRKGRIITRSHLTTSDFILEGTDTPDRTSFYIAARNRGGEIRGLSIVYSNRYAGELANVIREMIRTFDPFPIDTAGIPRRDLEATRREEVKRQEEEVAKRQAEEVARRQEVEVARKQRQREEEESQKKADEDRRALSEKQIRDERAKATREWRSPS